MLVAEFGHFLGVIFAPRHKTLDYYCSLSRQAVNAASSTRTPAPRSSPPLLPLTMANSRFQYVKKFELSDALLPDTYLIARLDGHRFTKFTAEHGYTKPNDERGLLLMAEVRIV